MYPRHNGLFELSVSFVSWAEFAEFVPWSWDIVVTVLPTQQLEFHVHNMYIILVLKQCSCNFLHAALPPSWKHCCFKREQKFGTAVLELLSKSTSINATWPTRGFWLRMSKQVHVLQICAEIVQIQKHKNMLTYLAYIYLVYQEQMWGMWGHAYVLRIHMWPVLLIYSRCRSMLVL